MKKDRDARDLAVDLIDRSTCNVQVASVIVDAYGKIMSWGWNNSGPNGYGICAERHAISRSNHHRLAGAVCLVAGRWKATGKVVNAKPCAKCQRSLKANKMLCMYRNERKEWVVL